MDTEKQVITNGRVAQLVTMLTRGDAITPEDEKRLVAWVGLKARFGRWKAADIDDTEFGGSDDTSDE
jgi:hypothetical protein